tara:strand:+ start:94 stop:687 length:594 start_codon:yes stop_codon:yes gene_type:complete
MALDSGALPKGTATDVALTQFNLVTSAINNATPWGILNGGHGFKTANSGFNALSPTATKGDLAVFTSSGINGIFPTSSIDNLRIVTDSGTHSGWKLTAAGAGAVSETKSDKTANFSAVSGNRYFMSGSITADLPATPSDGNRIAFVDPHGNWATSNVSINPNGKTILLSTSVLTGDVSDDFFVLEYNLSTTDWRFST